MKSNVKVYIALQLMLMLYSLNSIFSKYASAEDFLSLKWCIFYGLVILLLGIYALGWQQIIKRMPLTTAYANKAVTTVWGLIWGYCFFKEEITAGKIIGVVLVMAGVVLFALSDRDEAATDDTTGNVDEAATDDTTGNVDAPGETAPEGGIQQ